MPVPRPHHRFFSFLDPKEPRTPEILKKLRFKGRPSLELYSFIYSSTGGWIKTAFQKSWYIFFARNNSFLNYIYLKCCHKNVTIFEPFFCLVYIRRIFFRKGYGIDVQFMLYANSQDKALEVFAST